jgi:DNA-binding NtrC family response regulator
MKSSVLVLSDGDLDPGGHATVAADREAAAEQLSRGGFQAICLDRREVGDAIADANWLRRRRNRLPVVAIVEADAVGRGVELLSVGVEEIIVRSRDTERAVVERLEVMGRNLGERPGPAAAERVVARSPAMRACLEFVEKAQRTLATVLLQGETGTGKEVIARVIHDGGERRTGPFVGVNCAAFPETLLESELFGYERGAFTGATRTKRGLFQEANGGTLFLDEIGETALGFQVKLLRVLQEGLVRPLGATRESSVDVRIIAATNRDLLQEVETGRFRRDLFYRLHVFPIYLPPLRGRAEDIEPLAEVFLAAKENQQAPRGVAPDAARLLETYAWPGNVRELENEVSRIVAGARGEPEVTARMLSPEIQGLGSALPPDPGAETLRATMARLESWVLRRALERHAGRRIATARSLGITRECLYKKLKRYKMQ